MLKFLIQQIYGLSNRTIFYQYYTVHAYVFIHFCGSRWSFLGGRKYVQIFYHLFIYVHLYYNSNYQKEKVGIPSNDLALPQFCACPKPAP